MQSDFETEFNTAQNLVGAPGYGSASARLYSMLQWKTTHDVISASPAAMATNMPLLLGMWCSSGPPAFPNELTGLRTAFDTYCHAFTSLVVGISGRQRGPVSRLAHRQSKQSRHRHQRDHHRGLHPPRARGGQGNSLKKTPIGHVETWTEWVDLPKDQAVLDAVDRVGVDAYSYW
ncbi:glycoside hydrolase family 17 protein [Parathielavia appendiculata]|uniref:glucan endo-1,3-beta-D-glucosidase n=1 Tax=Parathielavia appendiculata TaxID=2587402 RepID=A0AAN6U6N5_9PEZI|nr:glycoside hydrolase family 17 protein [Parathielavia appendiculata]